MLFALRGDFELMGFRINPEHGLSAGLFERKMLSSNT